jgi:hypothetical protein
VTPIDFVPNDPLAALPTVRMQSLPDRPAGRAQVRVRPPDGSSSADQALFSQCRQAVLGSLAFWEECRGTPLDRWAVSRPLELQPFEQADHTGEPDASFDGLKIVFRNTSRVRPAESVDVVTHELGHAVLNAAVPELRNSSSLEHAAFHEAFGDCLALLTALSDPVVAAQVLATGLGQRNTAETLLESLTSGVAAARGLPPTALARHALNATLWSVHPDSASALAPEYALSLAFTGAIYDAVAKLFRSRADAPADALGAAARRMGVLLAQAVRDTFFDHNLFLAIGNAMLNATADFDEQQALQEGFSRHGLEITDTAMTQVEEFLAPDRNDGVLHAVGPSLARRVSRRFGVRHRTASPPMGRLQIRGQQVYWIGYEHPVSLGAVHASLRSVRTSVYQETWLTRQPNGWAVVQRPRAPRTLEEAALAYVEDLYKRGAIENRRARRLPTAVKPTHVVRRHTRGETLERRRFACCG